MNYLYKKEEIIKKGAEANLYLGTWFGNEVIFKCRIPKNYRIKELDQDLRSFRTINEARALIRAKEHGINVPQIYEIDTLNTTIIMGYIRGQKLKDIIKNLNQNEKERIFETIGQYIAKLHQNGQIHGDITTSNIILTSNEKVFLIDFGLHEYSDSIEDKSVDLHLFKRVLMSSHGENYEFCFKCFLNGYRNAYLNDSKKLCQLIINNIKNIETRGRYIKKEDRA
ncbi:MAG: Kae1-associated serine/threonine protein kinase [Promethearchaeota archaeon]|nr:MAG: Kae1-associated serine/threonine protein kinase [Candidatus Lokiarchaeota archaeon]